MVKLVNRAKMKVASGGAGTLTLGTACDGYQTFAAGGVTDQDKLRYTITDGDDWEIGIGTYTASGTTLARAVTESSNSGNAITCGSEAEIFVTMSAEDFTDNAAPAFTSTIPDTLALAPGTVSTIDAKALDDDGFPISYSFDAHNGTTVYSASSLPPQLSAVAINQTTGVFSLTGTSSSSGAGDVNFRVRASDGVRTATKKVLCNLSFFPLSGLTALYDANDSNSYSGTGGTWYDVSGNSGPNLTFGSDFYGSVATYNASGIGGLPQMSVTRGSSSAAAFYHGNSFPVYDTTTYKATVAVIFASDYGAQAGFPFLPNGNGSFNSAAVWSDSSTTGFAINRGTGSGQVAVASATSKLYIDGVDQTTITGAGFRDALGLAPNYQKYHSVVLTDGYYSDGFRWNNAQYGSCKGHVRAIAFWNRALTSGEALGLHKHFAADYSSSDMVQ